MFGFQVVLLGDGHLERVEVEDVVGRACGAPSNGDSIVFRTREPSRGYMLFAKVVCAGKRTRFGVPRPVYEGRAGRSSRRSWSRGRPMMQMEMKMEQSFAEEAE